MRDIFGKERGACKECRVGRPGICCEYEWDPSTTLSQCLNCGCKPVAHYRLPSQVSEKADPTPPSPTPYEKLRVLGRRAQRINAPEDEHDHNTMEVTRNAMGLELKCGLDVKPAPNTTPSTAETSIRPRSNPLTLGATRSTASPRDNYAPQRSSVPLPRTDSSEQNTTVRASSVPLPSLSTVPSPSVPEGTVGFLAFIDGQEEEMDAFSFLKTLNDTPPPKEIPRLNIKPTGSKLKKKFHLFGGSSSDRGGGSGSSQTELALSPSVSKAWFGVSLQDLARRPLLDDIPSVLALFFQCLEKKVETEGIFRIAGVANKVQETYLAINRGEAVDFAAQDQHNICSLVSRFLDELPDPLLTYDLYDSFMHLHDIEQKKMEFLQELIFILPDMHALVLEKLLKLLRMIVEKQPINKMSTLNVAIVFAPLLLRDEHMDQKLALFDASIAHNIVSYILDNADKLDFVSPFPTEKDKLAERKKKRVKSEEWRSKRQKQSGSKLQR